MIKTGRYFENIVSLLSNFRTEVQISSSLGLLNINKHSENFLQRILNLTHGFELENLNKGKLNFPGLDLGDTGEKIAYQITATKKSDKIDETLLTCVKRKYYETFTTINVFILTAKQSSYTIKTITEPLFKFSVDKNILDFNDLLKDIEHLDLSRLKALHDYIETELQPTIEAIKSDKADEEKKLLDVAKGLEQSQTTKYSLWQAGIALKNQKITVPEIYTKLNAFLPTGMKKHFYLPILNDAFKQPHTPNEILYVNELQKTEANNYFFGFAMLIETSLMKIEKASYATYEMGLNLSQEMMMMITAILFFSNQAKSPYEIEVSIRLEANTKAFFSPQYSLVKEFVYQPYILNSPWEINETISNVDTSTLVDLLQKIVHGFTSNQPSHLSNELFLSINQDIVERSINNIKDGLGLGISVW